jgi:hypothetical protein
MKSWKINVKTRNLHKTPVMSSSVTFVTISPVVRISLSHCWITFNCSGGIVLMSSAWNESGPGVCCSSDSGQQSSASLSPWWGLWDLFPEVWGPLSLILQSLRDSFRKDQSCTSPLLCRKFWKLQHWEQKQSRYLSCEVLSCSCVGMTWGAFLSRTPEIIVAVLCAQRGQEARGVWVLKLLVYEVLSY